MTDAATFADKSVAEHAHPVRHCEIGDLFAVGEGAPAELLDALREYLSAFAAPVKQDGKRVCFHCGKTLDSFLAMMGSGAAYKWGIAHGEGRCSNCHWPARGHHFAKMPDGSDLFTAQNFWLAYHPDQVSVSA